MLMHGTQREHERLAAADKRELKIARDSCGNYIEDGAFFITC